MGQITRTFPNFLLPDGKIEIQGQQADPNPTLAGDLDVSTQAIVSSNDGDINITPDGTGSIVLDGLSWPQSDGTANQIISTDGAGNLVFTTSFDGQFSSLTGTPTTINGYGITDAIYNDSSVSAQPIRQHYSNQSSFPSASTWHGAIAHSHSDGAMYFAHGGSWNKLANDSDVNLYTDSDVDTHLNTSSATTNQYLTWSGTDYVWAPPPSTPNTYTDSDVDTHLNTSSASTNEVLSWNGSDYAWVTQTASTTLGALTDVNTSSIDNGYLVYSIQAGSHNIQALHIEHDTTPSLGGNLDTNSKNFANGVRLSNNGIVETFVPVTGVVSTIALSALQSHSMYISSATNNKTLNITNLSIASNQGTNITAIWSQGSTPYMITALTINGSSQTINWQGGSAPSGTANGVDVITFSIFNTGSAYVVMGQSVSYS